MGALTARLVADRGALDALAPAWTALLEDGARGGLFSTPEWQLAWLDTVPGSSPRYVVVSDDAGTVRGVLPLAVRRRRVGGFPIRTLELGGEALACGDHLGFVVHERDAVAAWQAAAPVIRSSADGVDLVRLASLDADEAAAAAGALEGSDGWHFCDSPDDIAPRMPLPRGGVDPLDAFQPPRRKRLKYYERHFSASHPSGAIVLNDARMPLAAALSQLDALHGARWRLRGESGVLTDGDFATFVRRFVALAQERRWLRLYQLHVDDRVVATLLALHRQGIASAWLLGWDPAFGKWNVAELLFLHSLREAAREGVHTYDFLRGREPYKFRFPVTAPALLTREWTTTRRGRVAVVADRVSERVRASGRRWRTRAERVVRRVRRVRD